MIFPQFRSGKINTFACPATFEFGIFDFATLLSTAASNCIGPSIAISGAAFCAISSASFTKSIISPFALSPVE